MPVLRLSRLVSIFAVTLLVISAGCDSNEEPEVVIVDLQIGEGIMAERGMEITVDYTGWLTDQTEFDSSVGEDPLTFTLGYGRVIRGWDQGLVGMRVGGVRRLTIPPELAYGRDGIPCPEEGETGPPCTADQEYFIPPNATLIFEVHLLHAVPPSS